MSLSLPGKARARVMKALIVLLLTLSPSWSGPVGDAEMELLDDGVHNHTDPARSGKGHTEFTQNKFELGDIGVEGNVTGEQVSIGHDIDISIEESMHELSDSHTHTSKASHGHSHTNASHAHSHQLAEHYRPPYYHHPTEKAAPSEPVQTFQASCQNGPFDRILGLTAMTAFNIATFVIGKIQYFDGMISSQDSHEDIMSKLNEIKDIATATQKGVNELLIAADFMDEQLELSEAHTKILSNFNRMSELKRLQAPADEWITWAQDVLFSTGGTVDALDVIHSQIIDNNVISKFKNKAASKAASLTRTVAGSIQDFFQLQVIFQMIGFKTLEKANKHFLDCQSRDFDYKVMIERANKQVKQFKKVDASLPATSYLQNSNWGSSYLSLNDARYAHLHPVEADGGKVVTGVQLYQYKNRVAIKIKQGRVQEFGRIDSESWKDASAWGGDINLDYIQIYKGDCHYIDLHTAKVPDGHAIVGISFYKKGNRLGVKVKAAAVDYVTGKVDTNSQWISAPGWGDAYTVDYYNTQDSKGGSKDFVDTHVVETKPSGLLTAAALYLKGNRMAVQVSDVFKPWAEGESCSKYSNVKMIGKYECCDGYLYDKEGSQECPDDGNGPIYETGGLDCTGIF